MAQGNKVHVYVPCFYLAFSSIQVPVYISAGIIPYVVYAFNVQILLLQYICDFLSKHTTHIRSGSITISTYACSKFIIIAIVWHQCTPYIFSSSARRLRPCNTLMIFEDHGFYT